MGVGYMSNPADSRTKDFFSSPALSLTLVSAGIFRGTDGGTSAAATSETAEVEEGKEGSGGREETVELSSENSGPTRSDDEYDVVEGENEDEDDNDPEKGSNSKKKKRKRYHRHTAEQIREMEALFKEFPHPDEKQRQQLSKQLGLAPRQVKFWFQNRRTQIKAIQERHENSILKSEIEKLRDENKVMRDTIQKACCPNCGFATLTANKDPSLPTDEQLRIENARLKSEVEKLRMAAMGRTSSSHTGSPRSSLPSGTENLENRSSRELYSGVFGLEKSRVMDIVNEAMEEVKKMAVAGEPLWVRSNETGREILNYDEYMEVFAVKNSAIDYSKKSIEASRESALIFVDLQRLIQSFMDVNQWKEMFPCLISKATIVDVICNGEGTNRDVVQLMFAELQMLTPMVPTREVYFLRHCKQLSADEWAIIDVSIDIIDDALDPSLVKNKKRPSGCIIQDTSNGHCKVMWVEHWECQKSTLHSMFRTVVNSGQAFDAKHWMATLQLQCERLVFFMATNVPTKDSSDVATLAGRKSVLKLAHRMTQSFCHALGASSHHTWTKILSKTGEDIRLASRKNLNDTGEPIGLILCVVSSVWLPISPHILFEYLKNNAHQSEWDIMSSGSQVQSIAILSKGQDPGNSVTIQKKSKEGKWILQDTSTNAYESMVVYAPVEAAEIQSVMKGCDSTNASILPSGFSILPDGIESRPLVIRSMAEERSTEGGSLLTVAFQIQTNPLPEAKLGMDSVESAKTLISCTLQEIKKNLQCEDG